MYDRGPRWSEPLLLLVNLLLLVSLSVNLLAGGAVAGAVGHEDEEIAVLQNLLRLLPVHRYEKIFTYAREKRIFLRKVKKKGNFFTNYYTFCSIRAEKGPFLW